MTDYLTIIEVLEIHSDLIERYGGSQGVRDLGALESALYRPQSGYYQNLLEEAAAQWESLSQNHPFVDGNKRVGFAVTYTFLKINGYSITSDSDDTYQFMSNLYETSSFQYQNLLDWLKENAIKDS